MKKITATKFICASLASLMLSACSDDSNPLNEMPVADAVTVLTQASEKASSAIGLKRARAGDNYRLCMQQQIEKNTCKRLVSAMKKELSKEHVNVSEAQITDSALYKNIAPQLSHASWLME